LLAISARPITDKETPNLTSSLIDTRDKGREEERKNVLPAQVFNKYYPTYPVSPP
jgi:hypothetical protein